MDPPSEGRDLGAEGHPSPRFALSKKEWLVTPLAGCSTRPPAKCTQTMGYRGFAPSEWTVVCSVAKQMRRAAGNAGLSYTLV